jgi:hypothetical protein
MKISFVLATALALAPCVHAQTDDDVQKQIGQATEAAKKMGVDVDRLMEESAKEDAAEEAAEKTTAETPEPSAKSEQAAARSSAAPIQSNVDLPPGAAKGSSATKAELPN